MRTSAPIQVIVHYPKTEEGKQELARRVADVHADFVISSINKLNCPIKQKLELLQAVIDTTKGTYKAPEAEQGLPPQKSTRTSACKRAGPRRAMNRTRLCRQHKKNP